LGTGIVHLGFTRPCRVALLWLAAVAGAGVAQGRAFAGPAEGFVAVAAVGGATRVEGDWDSAFGGEVAVGSLAAGARPALAGWAVSAGAVGFAERTGARLWGELNVASRWPGGWMVGLGAGPAVDLDQEREARAGGQATLWAWLAVIPYVRVGALEHEGEFVELGVRLPFPTVRW
jgi:hypothetical protein